MIGSDRFVSDFHSNLSDPIRTDPNVTTLLFGSDRIRLKTFGSDESDNPIRSVYIPRPWPSCCPIWDVSSLGPLSPAPLAIIIMIYRLKYRIFPFIKESSIG